MKTKLQEYQNAIQELEKIVPKTKEEERAIQLEIQRVNIEFSKTLPTTF